MAITNTTDKDSLRFGMEHADYDPSKGITFHITGLKMPLNGQSLDTRMSLKLEKIIHHRVTSAQEASRAEIMQTGRDENMT